MKTAISTLLCATLLIACAADEPAASTEARIETAAASVRICPGAGAQDALLRALFSAQEGDSIELCAGTFHFDREIPIHDKRGITLSGAGRDQTIISFARSKDAWGITAGRVRGFTIQGMTIRDAQSIGFSVYASEQMIFRDMRIMWTGYDSCAPDRLAANSCTENGDVGAAFEFSRDILIEDAEFLGASVAGLIHILPRDTIVRRARFTHNTIGFMFAEAWRSTVSDSSFENNTLGVLMAEAPENNPHGVKSSLINNRYIANNMPNITPAGSGLNVIPPGIGALLLATDQYEIADSEFIDNDTTAVVILNYGLIGPGEKETRFDFYPEGLNIHGNLFRDNGGQPLRPDPRSGPAAALVPLLLSRNGGKSAQIIWDGAVDSPNDCTEVPRDERGVPLNQPNPDSPRSEARTDERGRPNLEDSDPTPACRWNAWKFDQAGELKPANRIYIDDNRFESSRPQTALVDDFVNVHVTSTNPDQLAQDLLVPPSNDLSPHAGTLPSWPIAKPDLPYRANARSNGDRVTAAQAARVCKGGSANQVNWSALRRYDCPELSDYALFADPREPRRNPNGGGMLYKINTPLFSDYAVKYRFLFVPPGKKIRYADYEGDPAVSYDNNPQRPLDLPVGSVIAKTFAFRTDDAAGNTIDENVVETRLLIKRQEYDRVVWVGMAYRWRDTPAGRVAELLPEGATTPVSFDYLDEDPEVLDAAGGRQRYTGAAAHYAIPAAASCASCHGGTTREAGASPISLKPRHLNREAPCAATGSRLNQLDCLVAAGKMEALPDVPANLERLPRWNVPGDSGEPAGSAQDVHQRMRAYLEINCSFCHSPDGRARFTDMYLDSFRRVDNRFGICRPADVAGRFDGRTIDIVPGDAGQSVLHYRDTISGVMRMPPLARSLTNEQASDLMIDWIDRALTHPSVEVFDTENCPPF